MKKFIAFSLLALAVFAGCNMLSPPSKEPAENPGGVTEPSQDTQEPEPRSEEPDTATPDGAAEKLLADISSLDEAMIEELAGQYFSVQDIPEEYYDLLKPIAQRVTYKIGNSKVDGDKASVDMSVSAVDAQSALNSVMPGAMAHLAAMQITGKDISNPEMILAEYAADNIDWDKLPTIKTDATLYLIKGDDGEWAVDVSNPDNLEFANAVSGGAVEVAQSLKSFADRFK